MSVYFIKEETLTGLADILRMYDEYEAAAKALITNRPEVTLTSLPEGITSIGDYAFTNCNKLALTSLPESVTSVGNYAFSGCNKLALTSIPETVTTIGNCAFNFCAHTVLTFKGTPMSIAADAFNGCTDLTTINVPWSEGEVANAPWGATNATINYNYVEV